ncbi:S-adenosyl-L-methionine-dependent methyltransferase [Aspergillus ambiguus]|uniref:class I SAM-dependent methyltransferase n=1 Tax=Aspergillus ambiguus TaxID=176160 RepID=UPI003CCD5418
MAQTAIHPSEKGVAPTIEVDEAVRTRPHCSPGDELDGESDESDSDDLSIKSTKSFEAHNIDVVTENDRQYCDESYFMPNDDAEQTRLNIVHQIYLILLDGKLTAVPLAKPDARILDIGTGAGDWPIEMSGSYPNATIIASDIGVFEGGLGHIDLPNVSFQLDDARGEWTYQQPFDLIHLRGLSGAFEDWSSVYQQAFKHLSPGGYIEIADSDPAADTISFPSSEDSYLRIYSSAMRSAAEAAGRPRDFHHLRPNMLSAAGFVDIRVLERTIPVGLWPEDPHEKTLGKMTLIALLEGLEAYSLRPLTATANWTAEQVHDLCDKVKEELFTADQITARVRIVTARKPFSHKDMREQRKNDVLKRLMQLNVDD